MPKRRYLRIVAVVVALGGVTAGGVAYSGGDSDIYVVQPGDSLWAIAARSGTTVDALAAANDMRPSDILLIGRRLTLPATETSSSSERSGSTSSTGASTAYGGAGLGGSAHSGGVVTTDFCSTHTPYSGPWTLPSLLTEEPSRLQLRPLFEEWGWHYGVRPSLLEALAWQESGWQQDVVSGDGAVGVGQVMPATAEFVEQQIVGEPLSLWSTSDNIRLEAAYVGYLQAHVTTTCDVIAAYYEGLSNLSQYGVLAMSVPYVDDVEYLLPEFS